MPACSGTSDAPGKGQLRAGQLEQQGEVSWMKILRIGVVSVLQIPPAYRPYRKHLRQLYFVPIEADSR